MPNLAIPLLAATLACKAEMRWKSLPDLPQTLAGQFVGNIGDSVVVAGGSFWEKPPWDHGTKHWVDTVYVLDRNATEWRLAGKLPQSMAYGASITVTGGIVLIGGQTAEGLSRKVIHLTLAQGRAELRRLADLPEPVGMMSGRGRGNGLSGRRPNGGRESSEAVPCGPHG